MKATSDGKLESKSFSDAGSTAKTDFLFPTATHAKGMAFPSFAVILPEINRLIFSAENETFTMGDSNKSKDLLVVESPNFVCTESSGTIIYSLTGIFSNANLFSESKEV